MFVFRAALEKKMAGRQGREDLIKKGLLEMMEQGKWGWARLGPGTQSWGSHGGPASPSGWSVPGVCCPDVAVALDSLVREVFQVRTHGSAPAPEDPSVSVGVSHSRGLS